MARDGRGSLPGPQHQGDAGSSTPPHHASPQALGFSQALLQEHSSRRPLPPTSGNHEWSSEARDGNLGLAPLAHPSQPCTQPGGCTKPPADLGIPPLVGGNPGHPYRGRVCHPAGHGQERERWSWNSHSAGGWLHLGGTASPLLRPESHSCLNPACRSSTSVCTSAHVLQEPQPVAKRLQMLEELCTAAGQQRQRGK